MKKFRKSRGVALVLLLAVTLTTVFTGNAEAARRGGGKRTVVNNNYNYDNNYAYPFLAGIFLGHGLFGGRHGARHQTTKVVYKQGGHHHGPDCGHHTRVVKKVIVKKSPHWYDNHGHGNYRPYGSHAHARCYY